VFEIIASLILGAALGVGLYQLLAVRWLMPKWRRGERAYQLADAQLRHERRRIASGPMFARAGQHLERITERAAHVLYLVENDRKSEALAALRDLQRHCQELADYMKPRKRRDDPEAWRL
jgi:hypothetical protein